MGKRWQRSFIRRKVTPELSEDGNGEDGREQRSEREAAGFDAERGGEGEGNEELGCTEE